MEKFFRLKENGASVPSELLCGLTTFLTMSYILFVNPVLLAQAGMPMVGVFVATALSAGLCSLVMAFGANVPFAMAPGMGLNTFFAYNICLGHGFHWKEALAISFLTGLAHSLVMLTGLRKQLVEAMPQHLRMASGVGLGFFIAYIGVKNAGFLEFSIPAGQYVIAESGDVIGNSMAVPGLARFFSGSQALTIVGLVAMVSLLALERKTGESYAAIPVGILAATFIGIPLNITDLSGVKFVDISHLHEFKEVFCSFFGSPGLMSVFSDLNKIPLVLTLMLIMLMTNVMDSIGTLIGIGQVRGLEQFDRNDMEKFARPGWGSKLDKALFCNSVGGGASALLGVSAGVTFIESITGIVSGGRTGLTALVAGLLFILCLPMSGFFSIVPAPAIAPAMIAAGSFMVPLVQRINWKNFEECLPAFMTMIFLPVTFSVMDGIAAGILTHVIIQVAVGKRRRVHPLLYVVSALFSVVTAISLLER